MHNKGHGATDVGPPCHAPRGRRLQGPGPRQQQRSRLASALASPLPPGSAPRAWAGLRWPSPASSGAWSWRGSGMAACLGKHWSSPWPRYLRSRASSVLCHDMVSPALPIFFPAGQTRVHNRRAYGREHRVRVGGHRRHQPRHHSQRVRTVTPSSPPAASRPSKRSPPWPRSSSPRARRSRPGSA